MEACTKGEHVKEVGKGENIWYSNSSQHKYSNSPPDEVNPYTCGSSRLIAVLTCSWVNNSVRISTGILSVGMKCSEISPASICSLKQLYCKVQNCRNRGVLVTWWPSCKKQQQGVVWCLTLEWWHEETKPSLVCNKMLKPQNKIMTGQHILGPWTTCCLIPDRLANTPGHLSRMDWHSNSELGWEN